MKPDRRTAAAAPLRAIDSVEVTARLRGLAVAAGKTVTRRDPYLAGHFPELTVYPGVFIIESLRQAVAAAAGTCADRLPEVHILHSARFLAPLLDGDTFTLHAELGPVQADDAFEVRAQCVRHDGVVAARFHARFRWTHPAGPVPDAEVPDAT